MMSHMLNCYLKCFVKHFSITVVHVLSRTTFTGN